VLDVVTADRVVAQISTVHPKFGKGPVPSVTFLGTRFENLRIGGHKVEVHRNLEILGPKRGANDSYFDDNTIKTDIAKQRAEVEKTKGFAGWADEAYPKDPLAVNGNDVLQCSVVDGISDAPVESFGHVIDLPHFGRIYLGELKVTREPSNDPEEYDKYRFRLTMIRLQMGCIAQGSASAVALDSNGKGKGGGG
jgi:hypothetical protein